MANYIYRCKKCKKEKAISHSMLANIDVLCECGESMRRVPQTFTFTWGGVAPSNGGIHSSIKNHINDVNKNKESYERVYKK